MRAYATFKIRPVTCTDCGARTSPLRWSYDPPPTCTCGEPTEYDVDTAERAHAVHGDEIDVIRKDGVCHSDGTPRRFRSREELRATERATGWRPLERGEKFEKSVARPRRPREIRPQY